MFMTDDIVELIDKARAFVVTPPPATESLYPQMKEAARYLRAALALLDQSPLRRE